MGDVVSGVTTSRIDDEGPARFRIDWVAWDSDFRRAGLIPGDQIIAVDGAPVALPDDDHARANYIQRFFGQVSESLALTGAPVVVTVRRRAPANGWTTLDVSGVPAEQRGYTNAAGRRSLSADGPDTMESDGCSESWGSWYEKFVARAQVLGREWAGSFTSQYESKQFAADHAARVALLGERYPGPFAVATAADYAAAAASAAGAITALPDGALDFRRRGDELVAEVRAAATAAWDAASARVHDSLVEAFPAPHPIRDGPGDRAGRHVVLPVVGNADYISDTGRTWFVSGNDSDGWYFVDAEAIPAQTVLRAQRRYSARIDPNLPARWQFLGFILPEPRLGMVGKVAHYGWQVEPVAALVGDGAMAVDLIAGAEFAGEAALRTGTSALPAPDADPATVLTALIDAVKAQDLDTWRALHADWWVEWLDRRAIIHPHALRIDDAMFEASLRSMAGRVLDARPVWTDDIRVVTDGTAFDGALRIEEVRVELDHIGSFDGVTRSFNDVTVRRWWVLQRVDGGPWRVTESQPI